MDIQQLFRAGDTDYKLLHTGYDESLPTGKMSSKYSTSALPEITQPWICSNIDSMEVVEELPSTHIPSHFSSFPLQRPVSRLPSGELPISGNSSSSVYFIFYTP